MPGPSSTSTAEAPWQRRSEAVSATRSASQTGHCWGGGGIRANATHHRGWGALTGGRMERGEGLGQRRKAAALHWLGGRWWWGGRGSAARGRPGCYWRSHARQASQHGAILGGRASGAVRRLAPRVRLSGRVPVLCGAAPDAGRGSALLATRPSTAGHFGPATPSSTRVVSAPPACVQGPRSTSRALGFACSGARQCPHIQLCAGLSSYGRASLLVGRHSAHPVTMLSAPSRPTGLTCRPASLGAHLLAFDSCPVAHLASQPWAGAASLAAC